MAGVGSVAIDMREKRRDYQEAGALEYLVVCLDEKSKQLVAEVRCPIPAEPGQPYRYDCEYHRNGTAKLECLFDSIPVLSRCRAGTCGRR